MMNKEETNAEIQEIENRIREVSSNVRFGNPMFSEWYEEQVDRIRELKEMLKKEEKEVKQLCCKYCGFEILPNDLSRVIFNEDIYHTACYNHILAEERKRNG